MRRILLRFTKQPIILKKCWKSSAIREQVLPLFRQGRARAIPIAIYLNGAVQLRC